MKALPYLLWMPLAGCLILPLGCAGHKASPRTAHLLDDKVISERVEVALREASPGDFRDVHVDTTNALVRLSGSAPNAQSKQAAERIAKGVQNVREVENEIEVR